jgi:hypothetical protein
MQEPRLGFVVCGPGTIQMLRAIDFDSEPEISAGEIQEVRADRLLAPELEAAHLAVPETPPEYLLRLSCIRPKPTSYFDRIWAGHTGSPVPIPQWGWYAGVS